MSLTRPRRRVPDAVRAAIVVAVVLASGAATVYFAGQAETDRVVVVTQQAAAGGQRHVSRLAVPARTVVTDDRGTVLATFTDGARTAVLKGPTRTFSDPKFTTATVTTTAWVRLLPEPWTPESDRAPWFGTWLDNSLADTGPDVLAVATDYLDGAPTRTDDDGVPYAGDAAFGPEIGTGKGRLERSDFYDYLGVPWRFPDAPAQRAEQGRFRMVDCSGFVRLVYGYRMGIPLRGSNNPGPGLPRRAWAIAEYGPGTRVIEERDEPATEYDVLQPGDLVFFNIDPQLGPQIDHTGIYLGVDSTGHHRFFSSRAKANGPTIGDLGGTSLLDDGGYYAQSFRTARRL